ncbi:MAG: PQQ-dependent sugar dehydrogenase, partial [Bryobacteraceae bacterium]
PHNVHFKDNDLYVGVNNGVMRFRDAVTNDLVIRSSGERFVTLPAGGQHSTRTAHFGPDGRLYVTAGSTCNFCIEADRHRAAMMRYDADGSGEVIYASGLRNSVSFAWHPVTGALWALDNGGDALGDTEPPEEINAVEERGDYGWPDCVAQRRPVNWGSQARAGRCGETQGPEWEMPAHSAPLGISFYSGDQFPASFQNDAIVALHGSWNRTDPSGYKVIRVRASSGRATGQEDLLWGFFDAATRSRSGRPVHAIPGPDGAVYVSDDSNGNIYRIRYAGPRINPGGIVRVIDNIYSLYGRNLAADPPEFGLYINGVLAETLYVSGSQINFVLPEGLKGDLNIAVLNAKGVDDAVIRVE